jgi:hypothetical protein
MSRWKKLLGVAGQDAKQTSSDIDAAEEVELTEDLSESESLEGQESDFLADDQLDEVDEKDSSEDSAETTQEVASATEEQSEEASAGDASTNAHEADESSQSTDSENESSPSAEDPSGDEDLQRSEEADDESSEDEEDAEEDAESSIPTPEELRSAEEARLAAIEAERLAAEEAAAIEEERRYQEELAEHLEDLTEVDARLLPELEVPDWRQELEFVKERYEPCDLSDHIVKVSKRRLIARQIDHELAQSRLNAYTRYLERASRRFKEKIDEDNLVKEALVDLHQWRSDQAKSVAWRLADRVNEEVLKAKQAEIDATSFVENNAEFTNADAIKVYRHFARRVFLIPVITAYIASVVGLTYGQFHWIMKFFPFFNLGISKTLIMISGIGSYFWIANLWRYSKEVAKTQKKVEVFTSKYNEQYDRIKHAVKQHTRLSQQQPLVEPILKVLAKGYRVQLESDVSVKAQVTTDFNPDLLPASVTLARAVDTDEVKMARLKRRALSVLMSPGWRTQGLDDIARIHADSRMLDSNGLSLKSLDTDSVVSAANAQRLLLDAFSNAEIHHRVSKARLVRAIRDLHFEVLANWNSEDRPNVESLRDDGFNKLSFRSSWLSEEDLSEDWIEFLTCILNEETAPFGAFNIQDKRSEINDVTRISSMAVVPHYFQIGETKVKTEKSPLMDVTPLDVVVRVDVSPWADPSAFAIFADAVPEEIEPVEVIPEDISPSIGSATSD